jgi:hypothetical protein
MRTPAAIALLLCSAAILAAAEPTDYTRDVLPILQAYCIGCHTADEAQGGLVMESHAALLQGGDSGLALTAGVPGSSRMLLMITGQLEPRMPPEGEQRPSDAEIEQLTAWIEQGAIGPDGDLPLKRELRTPVIETAADVVPPLTAVALSPDGALRAVARHDSVEMVRADGSPVSRLSGELDKVNSIRFSRDGSQLLLASGVPGAYGVAAVYAVDTGQLVRELVGHSDMLYAAVFSPDETLIATAGYDRQIILWDAATGQSIRKLEGHNGAIFDLAFSPDGTVLVSACADETAKVWQVATGTRLDTLSQPEGEVFAVEVTADGKYIIAGSADNRLRVWALRSTDKPRINPIVATRFVDESPLVNFQLTPNGSALCVLSQGGSVKVIRTSDWTQQAELERLPDAASDLSISPDGKLVLISLMNGSLVHRQLPELDAQTQSAARAVEPVYLDLGETTTLEETKLRADAQTDPSIAQTIPGEASALNVGRGVEIRGAISEPGQFDYYQWFARAGEVWAIDADAVDGSPVDTLLAVLGADNQPLLQTRLQAVRDSYFTFRGKDSEQIGDFRLFNWEEMHLNDYLYAAGEVTRLWMYPRGPDSGYNVYPGEGLRWTYFGTSRTTHALGEPAYIVRPIEQGETPSANGLPVFDLYYENDDDPQRVAGANSRLLFTAPADGLYLVRITDARGEGGQSYAYRLAIRAAAPRFQASVAPANGMIRRGTGREFIVRVDRFDGFDGPVTFDIPDLPAGVVANVPLSIEAGQRYAVGTLWVAEDAAGWEGSISPVVIARAEVLGRSVERNVGSVGELSLGDRPSVIPSIQPLDRELAEHEDWTLSVRRGETVSARVIVRRKDGFTSEVSFGKENAGRNTAHGVYVDNIGLNGLLVRQEENEREFFLTADPVAAVGKRSFFLTGEVDGNVTTHPITVEVLP